MDRTETRVLAAVIAGLAALAGWSYLSQGYALAARGGRPARQAYESAVRGAALDVQCGRTTPEELLHFAPETRPGHWRRHRMTYPLTPGLEISRLIHGAPGACNTTTPTALKGWLFTPPSEDDF
jgi:hypothetical protein